MTLVMVAQDRGFFRDNGVTVEIKEFTAGKFALQAFLSGAIDFAVSGEVPVALAALQGNPVRVVSQVVERTQNEVRVVALRDGGLTDPRAYFAARKRKLATSFGGGPEFFTYAFLKRYGIAPDQVEIISQKPEDMPAALATASVDAVAIFEPFAYFAASRSARDVVVFEDATLYSELYVLNARPEQLESRATEITAILRALVTAGDFVAANPAEAKTILRRYTKLDSETVDAIWGSFVFRPALTPALVELWEAQVQWARATGKVPADAAQPNLRGLIETRFLKAVQPAAVTLQ